MKNLKKVIVSAIIMIVLYCIIFLPLTDRNDTTAQSTTSKTDSSCINIRMSKNLPRMDYRF